MSEKRLPLDSSELIRFAKTVGTPFHIYDGDAIKANIRSMAEAFSWADGFINYFAVKALPNISILRLIAAEGFGADCSSLPELKLASEAGFSPTSRAEACFGGRFFSRQDNVFIQRHGG